MPNISDAEYAALKAAAASRTSTDVDEIAKRPYRVVKAPDGQALSYPPPEGPLTIGGLHPDDYYGVDDAGVATKGF
ncbi:MAG: hypothetical protein HY323_08115 [Betaproteobacteria bacterium]|nr:hypothetical protein [Betaproteobacteria bacterium]